MNDRDKAALNSERAMARLVGDLGLAVLAAFDDLKAAVELMDTKVTPYGTREDGTASAYIVPDSTWHRVLAIARGSKSDAAETAIASFRATPSPDAGEPPE